MPPTELPEIDRIVHETDAAYAVFSNGAAFGYRAVEEPPSPYTEPAVEEVTYLPGDFRSSVWDAAIISVAPDRVHECLVESLDEYHYYQSNGAVDELLNDWSAIGEVLTADQ